MSNVAIRVEKLGKQYRLGERYSHHRTLRDTIARALAKPFRSSPNITDAKFPSIRLKSSDTTDNTIWALRDLSFEVKRGEVIGIIGRNGAGKSTLLKVLSRITEPTEGYVDVYGKVGSLLEVGTGFHWELTGRENIFLNGAILGMKKHEIVQMFDEIVDFSEVEKFIDTPVKYYSSGMYLRLAFSVAAHLDPDILLVDEVLAVGDAVFQNKCIGKMDQVASKGRTVIYVSHNMATIRRLCSRCLYLNNGMVHGIGNTEEMINKYFHASSRPIAADINTRNSTERTGTGEGIITRVVIKNEFDAPSTILWTGRPFSIRIEFETYIFVNKSVVGVHIKNTDGTNVASIRSDSQNILFKCNELCVNVVTIQFPALPLYPGNYVFEPWIAIKNGKRIDWLNSGIVVTFEPVGVYSCESMVRILSGVILVDCEWQHSIQN